MHTDQYRDIDGTSDAVALRYLKHKVSKHGADLSEMVSDLQDAEAVLATVGAASPSLTPVDPRLVARAARTTLQKVRRALVHAQHLKDRDDLTRDEFGI